MSTEWSNWPIKHKLASWLLLASRRNCISGSWESVCREQNFSGDLEECVLTPLAGWETCWRFRWIHKDAVRLTTHQTLNCFQQPGCNAIVQRGTLISNFCVSRFNLEQLPRLMRRRPRIDTILQQQYMINSWPDVFPLRADPCKLIILPRGPVDSVSHSYLTSKTKDTPADFAKHLHVGGDLFLRPLPHVQGGLKHGKCVM